MPWRGLLANEMTQALRAGSLFCLNGAAGGHRTTSRIHPWLQVRSCRMYDLDIEALRKRIAKQFAQGTLLISDDVFTLLHTYSLRQLALIVATYHDQATAFLLNADEAWRSALALMVAIQRHMSPSDRACFHAALVSVLEGCIEHQREILDRLPTFDYVPRGRRIGIHITFPME